MKRLINRRLLIVTVLLFVALSTEAQHDVQFLAARTSWAESEFVGHAFMIISTRVGNGSKEDSYGFYAKGSKGVIIGPGIIISEFTENPSRFARISVSIRRPITIEQRRAVLRLVADWNAKNYSLVTRNCIDFVHAVASYLGWKVPPRNRSEMPETYLRRLRDLNEDT
jgi:hypothetical protein